MRALSRPGLAAILGVFSPVIWTWLVAVALVYAAQLGAGLGTPSMGLALSSAALPAPAVAATPTSLRRWTMVGAAGVLGLIALGDAAYHGFFGDYIPLSMAGAAGQLWEVKGYGGGLLTPGSALPTLALLATGAVAILLRAPDPRSHGRWLRVLPMVVSFLALCPAIGWAWMISPATGRQPDRLIPLRAPPGRSCPGQPARRSARTGARRDAPRARAHGTKGRRVLRRCVVRARRGLKRDSHPGRVAERLGAGRGRGRPAGDALRALARGPRGALHARLRRRTWDARPTPTIW